MGKRQFKVHVNGRPTKGLGIKEIVKAYPPKSIERIELITAPGSRYDAEGTAGGIINFVTVKKVTGYLGSINSIGSTLPNHSQSFFLTAKKEKFGLVSYGVWGSGQNNAKSLFIRDNYYEQALKSENRIGTGVFENSFSMASLEFSYEPDSVNTFSLYGDMQAHNNNYEFNESHTGTSNTGEKIESGTYFRNNDGTTQKVNIGFDYIRKIGTEGGEFSVLSGWNLNKDIDNDIFDRIFEYGPVNTFVAQPQHSDNGEQVVDIAFTKPLKKGRSIGLGGKTIFRQFLYSYLQQEKNAASDPYSIRQDQSGVFEYRQNIASLFVEYEKTFKSLSFKPGLRYELTQNKGTLNAQSPNWENYAAWFPSMGISVTINERQSLMCRYTRKIARPGMYYLNPQTNLTDPRNTSSGNPDLGPEYVNNMEINWGYSKKRRNFNINIEFGSITNVINGIQFVNIDNGVSNYTFLNTGEVNTQNINFSYSDYFKQKTSLSINGQLGRKNISGYSGDVFYNNTGLTSNANLSLRHYLPKSFSVQGGGSAQMGDIVLQGRSNIWYSYSVGVGKSLLKSKKLNLTLTIVQPFEHWRIINTKISDSNLYVFTEQRTPARMIQLYCNWSFGRLNANVSKKRGVNADDLKG